jgi:hypothetical protein
VSIAVAIVVGTIATCIASVDDLVQGDDHDREVSVFRRYGRVPLAFLCNRPTDVAFIDDTRIRVGMVNDEGTVVTGTVEVDPRTLGPVGQLDDGCEVDD